MRRLLLPAFLAALLTCLLPPGPAAARGGVWFGFGIGPAWGWGYPVWPMMPWWVAPVPAYYPPPAWVPPPHAAPAPYAAPAPAQSRRQARLCRAWPVSCPLPRPLAEGDACGCPSNQGQLPGYASP
jgi:hypothetical protein